jgi:hypothetical protein
LVRADQSFEGGAWLGKGGQARNRAARSEDVFAGPEKDEPSGVFRAADKCFLQGGGIEIGHVKRGHVELDGFGPPGGDGQRSRLPVEDEKFLIDEPGRKPKDVHGGVFQRWLAGELANLDFDGSSPAENY